MIYMWPVYNRFMDMYSLSEASYTVTCCPVFSLSSITGITSARTKLAACWLVESNVCNTLTLDLTLSSSRFANCRNWYMHSTEN